MQKFQSPDARSDRTGRTNTFVHYDPDLYYNPEHPVGNRPFFDTSSMKGRELSDAAKEAIHKLDTMEHEHGDPLYDFNLEDDDPWKEFVSEWVNVGGTFWWHPSGLGMSTSHVDQETHFFPAKVKAPEKSEEYLAYEEELARQQDEYYEEDEEE